MLTAIRDFLPTVASLFFAIGNSVHWWLPAAVIFLALKLSLHPRFRRRWGRLLRRLAIAALFTYLATFVLLCAIQPRLMYYPTHVLQATPALHHLAYEDIWVPATTGASTTEKLHGWWIPQSNHPIGTLIYFHGAGLNIGFNVTQAFWLRQMGFNVLLMEYRGYGLSERRFPTEASLYQDAETTLAYLTGKKQIEENTIYVYGHSLGGAIAIELASHHPNLAGVIVHNSFTSMSEMVARSSYARWFPVQWILTQRFESLQKVSRLHVPILLIHAKGDPLIPVEMGKRLFKAARSLRKELVLVDTNVHDNAAAVYKDAHHLVRIKLFIMRAQSIQVLQSFSLYE